MCSAYHKSTHAMKYCMTSCKIVINSQITIIDNSAPITFIKFYLYFALIQNCLDGKLLQVNLGTQLHDSQTIAGQ